MHNRFQPEGEALRQTRSPCEPIIVTDHFRMLRYSPWDKTYEIKAKPVSHIGAARAQLEQLPDIGKILVRQESAETQMSWVCPIQCMIVFDDANRLARGFHNSRIQIILHIPHIAGVTGCQFSRLRSPI